MIPTAVPGSTISSPSTFGVAQYLGPLLGLAAGALGVLLGAPLVAAEFERGTHQWVWTQGVGRTRWMSVKVLLLAVAVGVLCLGLSLAFRWWDAPLASLTGPFGKEGSFDNAPLILAAYGILAFGLGIAASTLLRRTVAAIGLALLLFVAIHLGLSFGLRMHYQTPLTVDSPATAAGPPISVDPRDTTGAVPTWTRPARASQQSVNQSADPAMTSTPPPRLATVLRPARRHPPSSGSCPYGRAPASGSSKRHWWPHSPSSRPGSRSGGCAGVRRDPTGTLCTGRSRTNRRRGRHRCASLSTTCPAMRSPRSSRRMSRSCGRSPHRRASTPSPSTAYASPGHLLVGNGR